MKILSMLRMPIFSIICIWVFILGFLSLHLSDKNDSCSMTYMFEYPQFVRISVDNAEHFPQYGLYAYSEGRFTERARKMWFDGVPVLFLPGNSGSHMQARSLASVALRKAISSGSNFHFDFFTISFNEEISGLYGGVLEKQTEFTYAAMTKILRLYEDNDYTKSVPSSVILIGHSMGGVVAKRLLGQASTMNKTNLVIALAAPLLAPVMNFDTKMDDFYMKINNEWQQNVRSNEDVKASKLLLSFGGGYRDVLVPSGLTIDNDSYISAATTGIPGAWVSPDHVGIVWCKQVVMAINRFLFSIIDPATQQLNDNMDFVRSKARMYFQSNRSITLSPSTAHANAPMTADAFWYEDNRRVYQISRPDIDKLTYLMIRLVGFPQNRFVAIEGVNVSDSDWVFGCNAKHVMNTYRYCSHGTSLSELTRWTGAASKFGKRKLATIHLHDLAKEFPDWTHVVVKVSPTRKPVILNVDINDLDSRQIQFNVAPAFFGKTTVIQETELGSLYYEIILPHVTSIQQAFQLYVEPSPYCKATRFHVSAEMHVPWAPNHEYYHYFTHTNMTPMKVRLVSSKPLKNYSDKFVQINLLLDPQCTFSVSITISWYQRLAQLVRNYIPVLIPYMGGIMILVFARSISLFVETGNWISFRAAIISLVSSMIEPQVCYGAVVGVTILMAQVENWTSWFISAGWNNRELQLMFVLSGGVFPTVLASLTFLYTIASIIQAVLMFSSQVTHRFFFRIVWWGAGSLAEELAAGLQKVPLVVSIGLLFGAPFSCGAASLVVGAAFYAFMISKMYEEYLEDFMLTQAMVYIRCIINRVREPQRPVPAQQANHRNSRSRRNHNTRQSINGAEEELNEQSSNLNFHFTMFLLWLTVAMVNVPALLTWARNFSEERILKIDTSFIPGVVMSLCSICLWQMGGPRKNLCYRVAKNMSYFIALIVLSLGSTSLFLIGHGITLVVFIFTFQQLFDRTNNGHFFGWFAKTVPSNQDHKVVKGKKKDSKDNKPEQNEIIGKNMETKQENKESKPINIETKPDQKKIKPGEMDTKQEQKEIKPEQKGTKLEQKENKPGEKETKSGEKETESGEKVTKSGEKETKSGEKNNKPREKDSKPENKENKRNEKSETGEQATAASSSNSDEEPGQSDLAEIEDENNLLYKIKKLKEKFSFLENYSN